VRLPILHLTSSESSVGEDSLDSVEEKNVTDSSEAENSREDIEGESEAVEDSEKTKELNANFLAAIRKQNQTKAWRKANVERRKRKKLHLKNLVSETESTETIVRVRGEAYLKRRKAIANKTHLAVLTAAFHMLSICCGGGADFNIHPQDLYDHRKRFWELTAFEQHDWLFKHRKETASDTYHIDGTKVCKRCFLDFYGIEVCKLVTRFCIVQV
jgi:hypothetical protein